jgi:hypothetical protein
MMKRGTEKKYTCNQCGEEFDDALQFRRDEKKESDQDGLEEVPK